LRLLFIGCADSGNSTNVFSADVFHSVFKANSMDSDAGKEYRRAVLEKGGSNDGMRILFAFLGREPRLDPFYEELGVAKG
jgi:metallopeptidase MepB